MKRISHRDILLATESFGTAGNPALVMVMGATASMMGWPEALCRALATKGLFVVRFDHRDTGQSTTVPPGEASYSVEDMAGDVLTVMDGYGIRRAHLAGMSLGGYIAQIVALQEPERVASLTLIASEPLGWDGDPLPHISEEFLGHFAALGSLDWSHRDAAADFLMESERLCAGSGAPFDGAAAKAVALRVLARTDSPASMFNHGSVTTREDWTGRFREISCPVLVIHGDEDPILPVENGQAIADGIPGAQIEVLTGVGHELPLRWLDWLADRIARHVSEAEL
jgi:pimeloyl-ACP methyl ester carboxylesterase